jgi:hypothetical protein
MGEDDILAEDDYVITICGCFSIPVKTKVFQVIRLEEMKLSLKWH